MNILLPIETINREIDFKLVLASLLVEKNVKVYIGQHDYLMSLLPKMSNGIYVGKNVIMSNVLVEKGVLFDKLHKSGFDVIYLNEEGAVFKGTQEDWKKTQKFQYDFQYFDKERDMICDWGTFQTEFDISRSSGHKIITTGHPRFDLYKEKWRDYFDEEVQKLNKEYGNYILVNGNYGTFNHGLTVDYVFSAKGNYDINDKQNIDNRVRFFSSSGIQCLSMIELTHVLAEQFPSKNIIYRPHPSENHEYYKTIFKGRKNILVKHDGPVSPWILAADCIIHDGCTTALEAFFSDKLIINYKPFSALYGNIWLPNQLGLRLETADEVVNTIKKSFKENTNQLADTDEHRLVKELLYNFENDSFETLVSALREKINTKKNIISKQPPDWFINHEYLRIKFKTWVLSLISAKKRQIINYHSIKFYGLDKDYISSKVAYLEKKLNKKLKLHYMNENLVIIEKL